MKKQKQIYSVYFVNDNHLRKLYNFYIHQSFFERVMDVIVFFAIIFTLMSVVLEFLLEVDSLVLNTIHYVSGFVFLIFLIEIIFEYSRSKSNKDFFKKHWIDFFLIVFLSFYFLFVTYFGLAKISAEFSKFKTLISKIKHYKVAFKAFKK